MTCTCKNKTNFWHRLFHGSGTALFALFIFELIEEGLESVIAYCISGVIALFAMKVLSTLGIVIATQGIKFAIKRFVYPFIKTLTYKEGNDKMKFLKNYWTLVKGNKFTGLIPAIGFGLLSYYQTFWAFASGCWWFALIVALVFYNVAIFVGGETLTQILARIEEKTKNKELKAQLKKVQQAQAIVDKYEEAKKTIAEAPKN